MIYYVTNGWGLLYIFRLRGSVLPKACAWAIPCAAATVLLKHYEPLGYMDLTGVQEMWGGFTFVLGFVIVFRNNQAYMRFWEGATLIQQVRGEWFNAVSSLIAFCNNSREKEQRAAVEQFQHLLVRLMSLLYCCALQQVAVVDDDNFEVIDNTGLDQESLIHLANSVDRCEILLQWVQRLIVEAHNSGVLQISAPILSRSFQELSRGIVNLNNVRKIKEIPFPFPYSQASMVMLLMHWLFTPLFASQSIQTTWIAGVTSFLTSAAFWALNYIAQEIEQPFGEDPNDLPIAEMQMDMNRSLCVLLHPKTQVPPSFRYVRARDTSMLTRPSDLDLMVTVPEDETGERLESIFESEDVQSEASCASYDVYPSGPSERTADKAASDRTGVTERPSLPKASVVSHIMSNVTSMHSFATSRSRFSGASHATTTSDRRYKREMGHSVTSNNTVISKVSMKSVKSSKSMKSTMTTKSILSRPGKKAETSYSKLVARERARAQARAQALRGDNNRLSEGTIGEKRTRPAYVRVRSTSSLTTPSEEPQKDDGLDVADEADTGPATYAHGISRGGIEGQRASFRSESSPVPRSADVLLATPASPSQGAADASPVILNGPTPSVPRSTGGSHSASDAGDRGSSYSTDTDLAYAVVAKGSIVEGREDE